MAHPAPPEEGTDRYYVYTYPAKKAIASITGKVKALCRQDVNLPLEVLLHRLNAAMRGWCNYFRPGVSSAAFAYLRAFAWRRVFGWLRRKHPGAPGRPCAASTATQAGGPATGRRPCSTRQRYAPRGTATGARSSPPRGRRPQPPRGDGTCGEPDAVPSRTSGSGARPGETGWPQGQHRAPGRPHEHEGGNAQLKTYLRGPGKVLRSRSPALVEQELWGYLLTHYAISALICAAATAAGIDPDRVKFTRTGRITRRAAGRFTS